MASYRDASEQALVTTFSTSTTRQAEPSLAANVLYQAPPVFATTDMAQQVHGRAMYWSHVHVPAAQRPKLWVRLLRPTFDVSGAAHSWMRKGAFLTQLQK